jgi:hypothetical protein
MESTEIRIPTLPASADEFAALAAQTARTPEGGVAMLLLALHITAGNAALGRQCLAATVVQGRLQIGPHGFKGQELRRGDLQLIERQLGKQPYLPASYIKGATPANGYGVPELPYDLEISTNPYSGDPASGRVKLFVACSGAATPRPVTVERDAAGQWRAVEWSSLLVGIVAPA